MGQKSRPVKEPAEQVVKQIRRATRRQFSAEEKIRIVLSGLRNCGAFLTLAAAALFGLGDRLAMRGRKDRASLALRTDACSVRPDGNGFRSAVFRRYGPRSPLPGASQPCSTVGSCSVAGRPSGYAPSLGEGL